MCAVGPDRNDKLKDSLFLTSNAACAHRNATAHYIAYVRKRSKHPFLAMRRSFCRRCEAQFGQRNNVKSKRTVVVAAHEDDKHVGGLPAEAGPETSTRTLCTKQGIDRATHHGGFLT